MSKPQIKAVIFDIGGVVVGSPLEGIRQYEISNSLPHHYINVAITKYGNEGAFQKFEKNQIDLWEFYKEFGEQLSRVDQLNEWYSDWCKSRKMEVPNLPKNFKVDGRELFGAMMSQTVNPDRAILSAIRKMKAKGHLKIAALTNNIQGPTSVPKGNEKSLKEELEYIALGKDYSNLKNEFDLFIESSVVGMRKPDPKFYQYALDRLGVKGEETVFLDDIGINLKAAEKLGIKTIRVSLGSSLSALQQLEKEVGMKLIDDEFVRQEQKRLESIKKGASAKL